MEKPTKSLSKLFSFLPKSATISFQNQPPYSPGRERRFSGSIIPVIPVEARRRSSKHGGFDAQDPTSPKVSCIGQIKHKKKLHKLKSANKIIPSLQEEKKKKTPPRRATSFRNIFRNTKPEKKYDVSTKKPPLPKLPDRAPALGQMMRFASGRDSFSDFNWNAYDVKGKPDHRDFYSDDEREDSDDEEDHVFVPHSAPMMIGGGVMVQPKKEVNLWKRRTMDPPKPLQVMV
ncbi:hypothetical protein GIB67_028234 [Kingdonia uniflora]|uniref:Syringolide-induced protein 14-1-1 n=1 Tax=Kingdonia uniflora TaxID=39325 RepID=A0A7J7KZ84_9MAGN|nr:hypothetical protein GIB67_028234 [Kingdonia uniflora]